MENALDYLKSLPIWTIASTQKIPLDVRDFSGFKVNSPTFTFAQLPKFYENQSACARWSASQTQLMLLDIENKHVPLTQNLVWNILPTLRPLYVERSVNGGAHALIYVPRERINHKMLQKPKLSCRSLAEIFPNGNHFMSFTFDQIDVPSDVPAIDENMPYLKIFDILLSQFKEDKITQSQYGSSMPNLSFANDYSHQKLQIDLPKKTVNQLSQALLEKANVQNVIRYAMTITDLSERDFFLAKNLLKQSVFKLHFRLKVPERIVICSQVFPQIFAMFNREKWFNRYCGKTFIEYNLGRAAELLFDKNGNLKQSK